MPRKLVDSGVAWIGKIPEGGGWKLLRFKYVATSLRKGNGITKDQVFDDGDIDCIRYGELYSKYDLVANQCISRTKLECLTSPVYVQKGDVLIATTGELVEEIGKNILYSGHDPCVAGGDIIVATHKQDARYINYYLSSPVAQYQKSRGKLKLKVVHLRTSDVENLLTLIPPLDEQKRIAAFLDEKCAKIDALRGKIETQIEKLDELKKSTITEAVTGKIGVGCRCRGRKMKPSGVEWIGDIPEEWGVSRAGFYYDIQLGKMLCSSQLSPDYSQEEYFCAANVHYGEVQIEGLKQMWFSSAEKAQYDISVGDMLVVEGGAGAGGCAIVKEMNRQAYIQNSILRVRSKGAAINAYFCYWLEVLGKSGYIDIVCNKATIPHFTKEKLSAVPLPIPPLPEQKEIAEYLDKKCAAIDAAKEKCHAQLDKLVEYKKSLIYEYVTGKKEVQ